MVWPPIATKIAFDSSVIHEGVSFPLDVSGKVSAVYNTQEICVYRKIRHGEEALMQRLAGNRRIVEVYEMGNSGLVLRHEIGD